MVLIHSLDLYHYTPRGVLARTCNRTQAAEERYADLAGQIDSLRAELQRELHVVQSQAPAASLTGSYPRRRLDSTNLRIRALPSPSRQTTMLSRQS